MKGLLLLLAIAPLILIGCGEEKETIIGGELIEHPLGQTVVITGTIATLTLTSTYNVGVAVIEVSLTNTVDEIIIPQIVNPITQPYCYKVTVKDSSGNQLNTTTFGIDEFEEQFGEYNLLPGLTYSEYEFIYPWLLPDDPFGGKLRVDVWLSRTSNLNDIYHMWGEVNLAIEWP